jgi:hypothetical protein
MPQAVSSSDDWRDLLQLTGEQLNSWLALVETERITVAESFPWRTLAEWADMHVYRDVDPTDNERLVWARAGVCANKLGVQAAKDRGSRFSFPSSQLLLQCHVITRHGLIPGDPFFDTPAVLTCLLQNLPFSYEEAVRKVQQVRANPRQWDDMLDDLRALRRTKNLLNATRSLHDAGRFQQIPEVERWFELREALP